MLQPPWCPLLLAFPLQRVINQDFLRFAYSNVLIEYFLVTLILVFLIISLQAHTTLLYPFLII